VGNGFGVPVSQGVAVIYFGIPLLVFIFRGTGFLACACISVASVSDATGSNFFGSCGDLRFASATMMKHRQECLCH
jgi:hypothetical protein